MLSSWRFRLVLVFSAATTAGLFVAGCTSGVLGGDGSGDTRAGDGSRVDRGQSDIGTEEPEPGALDAPIRITERWWLSPKADEAEEAYGADLAEAVDVLQRYFGGDDVDDMLDVSVGSARDLARFLAVMEDITDAHPMEEVTAWEAFRIVGDDDDRLLVEGRTSEDRATGSGLVERRVFDRYQFVRDAGGSLFLQSFERNDVPIDDWILPVTSLPSPVEVDGLEVTVEGVHVAPSGVLQIAGRVRGDGDAHVADLVAEEVRLRGVDAAYGPRFVDTRADVGGRAFLVSFSAEAAADRPAVLELAIMHDGLTMVSLELAAA